MQWDPNKVAKPWQKRASNAMACAENNKKWKLSALTTANGFRKCTPPPCVAKLLDAEFLFGLKIQTHDWKTPQRKPKGGRDGQFGFYRACYLENLQYSRIVHVSWSAGSIDEAPVTKKVHYPAGRPLHFGRRRQAPRDKPRNRCRRWATASRGAPDHDGGCTCLRGARRPSCRANAPIPPSLEARGWMLASFLRNCAAPGWIKMSKIGAVSPDSASGCGIASGRTLGQTRPRTH